MAIISVGYAGTITDADWRRMAVSTVGAMYGVDDYASWRPTVGVGDRAVRIATGGGFGLGVRDVNDADVTLSLASVASGSRWDLIVARRNWTTSTTTFVVIQGTATKALPSRNTGYGNLNDQPVALVRVAAGQAAVQEILDLRCIPGDGGLIAFDDLARSYLDRVGTVVRIGDVVWTRTINSLGSPVWVSSTSAAERFEGRLRRSDGQLVLNAGATALKWQSLGENTLGATATVNGGGTVLQLPGGAIYVISATFKVAVNAANWSLIALNHPGAVILGSSETEKQTPPGYYELGVTRFVYAADAVSVGIALNSNNVGSLREDGYVRAFRLR